MHIHLPNPLSKSVKELAEKNARTPTGEVVHAVKKHIASEFVQTPKRKKKAAK